MLKKNYKFNMLSSYQNKIIFNNQFLNGKVSKPAIFFDRDGVIIEDVNYIKDPKKVNILPGVRNLLESSKNAGWLNIIVTNQSGISRGLLTWQDYENVTKEMINLLGEECFINAIYANSQKPNFFYKNNWRKPNPNMILEASIDFNINLSKSILIGDRETDLLSARNAGIKSFVHVLTGHGKNERESILLNFEDSKKNKKLIILDQLSDFQFKNVIS